MPIDLDLFMNHMRAGRGLVEVLLRAHLWIEKFLGELLEAELRDPAAIKLDRMPFAQKVDLAQALGLVSPDEAVPIRLLNRMRNKLAHDLSGDPSPNELQALEGSLNGLHRELFDVQLAQDASGGEVRRLEYAVHAIVASLEAHRQRHVYWRDNRTALEVYGIVRAMNERTGRDYDDEALRREHSVPDPPSPRRRMGPTPRLEVRRHGESGRAG